MGRQRLEMDVKNMLLRKMSVPEREEKTKD
jgi:hypothetical protein